MPFSMSRLEDPQAVVGCAPEQLSLDQRFALAGKCVAMEIYSPSTLPLRRIEAIGDSVAECVRQLRERGADPAGFEFTVLAAPY